MASTRFPEKALASLDGRPLVLHVLERCQQARSLDRVVVATDHPRIVDVVVKAGGEAVLTTGDHRCGTDRVWEVASDTDYQHIVNIQGDQPRLNPAAIDSCVEQLQQSGVDMVTVAGEEVAFDAPSSRVRVVTDPQNFAVSFSRENQPKIGRSFHHIGIYAFQRAAMKAFANRDPSPGELRESLEQLRVLEYGGKVKVVFVERAAPAVDRPEDLEAVRAWTS